MAITKKTLLGLLTETRDLLAEHFCKWEADGPNGTHCAMGAIRKVGGRYDTPRYTALKEASEASARELYPKLTGAHKPRRDRQLRDDYFDSFPLVFVNNHLGKKPTLAVFDHAIAKLKESARG